MSLSPMMGQYLILKEKYKDAILLFRLGDFYEMFFEDAKIASRVLELTLTGRDCGLDERAPMCGVPYHSVDGYINTLVARGYKVAICEQITDPKTTKGLVERDVVRVITPGTLTERSMLDEKKNNYLCSIYQIRNCFGVAWADVSTGDFYATELVGENNLNDCLAFVAPTELLMSDKRKLNIKKPLNVTCGTSVYEDSKFTFDNANKTLCSHYGVLNLDGFDCGDMHAGVCAAGGLLAYLKYTQKVDLKQLKQITRYISEQYLMMDANTRRNLELSDTLRGRGKKGSLLAVLDKTRTAMGGRMLRAFVERPLRDASMISKRLDGVEELLNNYSLRNELFENLSQVYDIERLSTKVAYGSINPRDCLQLGNSLSKLPELKRIVGSFNSEILRQVYDDIDPLEDICSMISNAISETATNIITEGGIFKKGYNAELDRLLSLKRNSAQYILDIETRERERTGIKNLKIGYNRVFGYYIEISKSFVSLAPIEYERKQTLAGGERYITPELKELEKEILSVTENSIRLEYELFCQIRERLQDTVRILQRNSSAVALVDALVSLAEVASKNSYVRPEINTEGITKITDGRHPVVEAVSSDMFVPNDTMLDTDKNRFMIITGPNMSGKSTYMRQVAIITLMAHVGSFVPAAYANISIADRIFTRVGASDDLSSGQSTFMLEMNEVAGILRNCSSDSLVVLDEIGRGTSTFDGLSIAWAVTEYLANKEKAGCKTMFATHYHELSELEGNLDGVKNYCIQVREHGEDVIFLRKILRGSADKSFGIAVAKLAGLPKEVLKRAKDILTRLEEADISKSQISANILKETNYGLKNEPHQLSFMTSPGVQEILDTLKETDINVLTPVAALNLICELREIAKRED